MKIRLWPTRTFNVSCATALPMPMLRIKNAISTFGGVENVAPSETNSDPTDDILVQEAEDEVPPLVLSPPQSEAMTVQTPSLPPWVRELNNSRVTRHSRASSIVSTRTKFSTTTLQDDARSIDISVGGQHFRISRDGSRITADPPPPYTGPSERFPFRTDLEDLPGTDVLDGPYMSRLTAEEDNEDDGASTPRSMFAVLGGFDESLAHMEMPPAPPMRPGQLRERSSSAPLASSAPADDAHGDAARAVLNEDEDEDDVHATPAHADRGTDASTVLDGSGMTPPSSLIARIDPVRLLRLTVSRDNSREGTPQPQAVRGEIAGSSNVLPQMSSVTAPDEQDGNTVSPSSISADGTILHSTEAELTTSVSSAASKAVESDLQDGVLSGDEENDTPLSMDDENDISLHYARMMRKLDYRHRKTLHLKDKGMAELREKLHEKDIVLRQQLRAKDFMIDDLKKRLANLEESMEAKLESARNQVEDLWEGRWKERNAQLLDRIRRLEEEARRTVESSSFETVRGQGRSF